MFRLVSRSELWARLERVPHVGLCAILASHEYLLEFSFCFTPLFCTLLSACGAVDGSIITCPPPIVAHLQQVLRPPWPYKKDNRPGDDISEIMSVFTRTPRPLHLQRKKRIRSLQMSSPHPSLSVHVESWWGEPLYAVVTIISRRTNIRCNCYFD